MKFPFVLTLTLVAAWLLWSGHFGENDIFLLILGALSVLLSLWVCLRMRIVDDESVPTQLGFRVVSYTFYLIKEIIVSNLEVTKIILSRKMPLQRNMIKVSAKQKTELGNVILANSITLTPGTVSVSMADDEILVHALNFEGAQEDLSGEMESKVSQLEGSSGN